MISFLFTKTNISSFWDKKGFGLIIPGFIPSTYGKIAKYALALTWVEIGITLGIWVMGALIFTMLTRTPLGIEVGKIRFKKK